MPTVNGVLLRRARHLVARPSLEGDTNHLGEPIAPGKKVIVQRDDCRAEDDGTLDPTTAEPIPQIPSDTSDNRIYGQWQKQRDREGQWIEGEFREEYFTCPVYMVDGPDVWQGTIYAKEDPRVKALQEAE